VEAFWPASNIDAINRFAAVVKFFLVDDGVNGDSRLAGLAVADDQLALTAADGNHRVDSFDTGLQRFVYRLAVDNPGRFALQRHFVFHAGDRAFAVDRLPKRVHHAAHETFTLLR
jgi:hypothetical protein